MGAPATLVTGAGGFIGSAVVRRLLARGRTVRCYVEPGARTTNLEGLPVELVTGDVNDRARVAEALKGCDALYHLAAIYALWLPDPARLYEVNVEGTKTVLWAALKAGLRRVVYTSSIAAVGRGPKGRPADERAPFDGWDEGNPYIRSKWLGEREALRFAAEGLPLVVVNPAFPFGERDLGPTPTGGFIVAALRGQLPGYLPGGFCAIDVEDVAEGHVLAEERGRVGERYILGDHNVTWRDFFRLVTAAGGVRPIAREVPVWAAAGAAWVMERWAARTGRPPLTTVKAVRYAARPLYFDPAKARAELGLPTTPLGATIDRAVRWFRAHGYA